MHEMNSLEMVAWAHGQEIYSVENFLRQTGMDGKKFLTMNKSKFQALQKSQPVVEPSLLTALLQLTIPVDPDDYDEF